MSASSRNKSARLCLAGLALALVGGCGALRQTATPPPAFYALESPRSTVAAEVTAAAWAPTLIVNPPHAAAGFDSKRIIYLRAIHQLEYFAHSEWVDTPARMLAPMIVGTLAGSGAFRAVIPTPSAAAGELRLDTEIVRLQQEFGTTPSRVHFTLRAYLVDNATRRVLAWREFDQTRSAASEDPFGGVVAANEVVQAVLQELSAFCKEVAGSVKTVN